MRGEHLTILRRFCWPSRGIVQLKKSKNLRKTRIIQTPPTHPLSNFLFFSNVWKHENNTKKQKKKNISKKKYKPSWGLTHPLASEFFSDFWIFFNLTKPLSLYVLKVGLKPHSFHFNLPHNLSPYRTEPSRTEPNRTAIYPLSFIHGHAQCHLIHLTILRRLSWPSLAYMCTKVA